MNSRAFLIYQHKKKLAIYVVASGIPYGGREDVFEQFFLVSKIFLNICLY